MKRKIIFVVVLLAAAVAWAVPASQESYRKLTKTPSEGITGQAGAGSTTATTPGTLVDTQGNPTVAVSVDFSGAASDTCVVSCLLFQGSTFIGLTTQTATAGAYVDAAGDNFSPLVFFDTAGATHYEVRAATPSAGNVDIRWWSYGAKSE